MTIRILESCITLDFIPEKDILNGIWLKIPKKETKISKGIVCRDIYAGQKFYHFPDGVKAEDITEAWLELNKNHYAN